jgi:hypothetical protein
VKEWPEIILYLSSEKSLLYTNLNRYFEQEIGFVWDVSLAESIKKSDLSFIFDRAYAEINDHRVVPGQRAGHKPTKPKSTIGQYDLGSDGSLDKNGVNLCHGGICVQAQQSK